MYIRGIKKSLDVLVELVEWCREWGVEINVAKSGIMHIRNKKTERCDVAYEVNGEASAVACSPNVLWSRHTSPQGFVVA